MANSTWRARTKSMKAWSAIAAKGAHLGKPSLRIVRLLRLGHADSAGLSNNEQATMSPSIKGESTMAQLSRYHPALVALHWLLAVLIIAALALGALVLVGIPNSDPMKLEALRSHMAGGALILTLMVIRLVVRRRTAHPAPATTGHSALDRLAWASHRLFYIAVLGMAGSGLVMALQTGLPSIVFAGHGALPPDFWAYPVRTIHYGISRLLMTLIALHVAGALYHTFFLKDRLLRRMGFGRRATVATMSTAPALNGSFPEVQS
jgi:cytochrome b561